MFRSGLHSLVFAMLLRFTVKAAVPALSSLCRNLRMRWSLSLLNWLAYQSYCTCPNTNKIGVAARHHMDSSLPKQESSVKQSPHFVLYVSFPSAVPEFRERLKFCNLQQVYFEVQKLLVRVSCQVSLHMTMPVNPGQTRVQYCGAADGARGTSSENFRDVQVSKSQTVSRGSVPQLRGGCKQANSQSAETHFPKRPDHQPVLSVHHEVPAQVVQHDRVFPGVHTRVFVPQHRQRLAVKHSCVSSQSTGGVEWCHPSVLWGR